MNIPKKWLISSASIILLMLAVYLSLPTALTRVAGYYLAKENIQLVKLDVDSVWLWDTHISSLELRLDSEKREPGGATRIECQDIHIRYHPGGLKDKQLDVVTIQQLDLTVPAGKQEKNTSLKDINSLLPSRWIKLMPVERVNIENIGINWGQEEAEEYKYHILGSLDYNNNIIESSFRIEEGIKGVDKKAIDLYLRVNNKDQLNLHIYSRRKPEQNQGGEKKKEYVMIQSFLKVTDKGVVLTGSANVDIRTLLSEANRFGLDKKAEISGLLKTLEIEDNIEIAFQVTSEDIHAQASVKLYEEKASAHIEVQHDFLTESGKAVVELDPFEFSKQTRLLSSMYSPWKYSFDVLAGKFGGKANITWKSAEVENEKTTDKQGEEQIGFKIQYGFQASDITGFYKETHFSGLNATGELEHGSGYSLRTPRPVKVDIKQVNGGVPVTAVSFGLSLSLGDIASENRSVENKSRGNTIYLHDFKGDVLDGKIISKKIKFDPSSELNNFIIYLEGISLKKILELQKQKGIEGTGVLDGMLPVVINAQGMSVSDGNLEVRKPGGIIRYRPDSPEAFSTLSNPNISLVMEEMENFHYKVLQSGVTYSPEGKLVLELRLEGRNPDMREKRPVNLNINVEQNILTLLKSLRLADDIGEKIGERMRK